VLKDKNTMQYKIKKGRLCSEEGLVVRKPVKKAIKKAIKKAKLEEKQGVLDKDIMTKRKQHLQ
jgi:hypothetical protein